MQAEPLLILLVEDDDGHAVLMQRGLARSEITNDVVRVRDGAEALDSCTEGARSPAAGRTCRCSSSWT